MGLTKKDAKLIWDNDCEQAFFALKKALVQPPVFVYPTRDGSFVPSTDATDICGTLQVLLDWETLQA